MLYKLTIKNTLSVNGVRLDDLQKACALDTLSLDVQKIN